jgi:hypothetical protein
MASCTRFPGHGRAQPFDAITIDLRDWWEATPPEA